MALINKLTAIADAIRGKTGKAETLTLDQMATEIEGIQTAGGGDADTVAGIMDKTIEEVTNDLATSVKVARMFQYNTALKKVNLPKVTALDSYVFGGCTALTDVNLPRLETMNVGNFENCTSLSELAFPALNGIANNLSFSGCTNLRKIDFGRKELSPNRGLVQSTFKNCSSLKVIVIRAENKIWEMSNINNFDGTPFAIGGTGGTAYVPQALIESYQDATNWSTLYEAGTCNFVAIEGSEYE